MRTERRWNGTDWGNRSVGTVPLCPPQGSRELIWDRTRKLRGERPATDRQKGGRVINSY